MPKFQPYVGGDYISDSDPRWNPAWRSVGGITGGFDGTWTMRFNDGSGYADIPGLRSGWGGGANETFHVVAPPYTPAALTPAQIEADPVAFAQWLVKQQENTPWPGVFYHDATQPNFPQMYFNGPTGRTYFAIPGEGWPAGGGGFAKLTPAQLTAAGGMKLTNVFNGPHFVGANAQVSFWIFKSNAFNIFGGPGGPNSQINYTPGESGAVFDKEQVALIAIAATAGIGGAIAGGAGAASEAGGGAAAEAGTATAAETGGAIGSTGIDLSADIPAAASLDAPGATALDTSLVAPGADAAASSTGAVAGGSSNVSSLWGTVQADLAPIKETLSVVSTARGVAALAGAGKKSTPPSVPAGMTHAVYIPPRNFTPQGNPTPFVSTTQGQILIAVIGGVITAIIVALMFRR